MSLQERRSRRHLARAERERRMRRYLFLSLGAIGVLFVGILGYGVYDTQIRQPGLPAISVNGQVISQNLFRSRVILAQAEVLGRYQNTRALVSFLAESPDAMASIQQELTNLQMQLDDPTLIGQQVQEQLIQDLLVREEALAREIEVSDAETDQEVQVLFGFYAQGTPTPLPTPTPAATSPTTAVTEATATGTVVATAGPSPTVTPTATASPSPTPYTLDLFESNYQTYLEELASTEITEEQFRFFVESQVYRRKLRDAFAQDVAREQEQVHARHILVDDEGTAVNLLQRLRQGEDWVDLAAEYSNDSANRNRGGDLGWFARGRMVEAFEEAAFDGEVGEIVGPVETAFGFHLIEILGHETRQLDDAAYETAVDADFNQWLQTARGEADLEILDSWTELLPTVEPYQ